MTDEDRPRWPRFKTKEAAQEIAARCHAMERQTKVHWRAVNMEDGSWIVAAYKDGYIKPPCEDGLAIVRTAPFDEMAARLSETGCPQLRPDLPRSAEGNLNLL